MVSSRRTKRPQGDRKPGRERNRCHMRLKIVIGALIGLVVVSIIAISIRQRTSPVGGDQQAYDAITSVSSVQEFDAQLKGSQQPVLVDVYATWCAPCKQVAPQIGTLSKEFQGKAKFLRVDGDKLPQLVQRYHIEGYPTVLIFRGPKPTALVGLRNIAEYREALSQNQGPAAISCLVQTGAECLQMPICFGGRR